jgi:hypothetical protein
MSGWRDHLRIHPACEAIPPISEEQLKGLAGDIKQHGLQKKIVLWRDEDTGKESLLDGRSRLDAMEMAGIEIFDKYLIEELPYGPDKENHPLLIGLYEVRTLRTHKVGGFPNDVKRPKDETPEGYVLSANAHRRHLTAEQKRDVIAWLLRAHPEKSNRQIGAEVGASHVTVGAVRAEMVSTGQIDQLPKTVGADGKEREKPERAADNPEVSAEAMRATFAALDAERECVIAAENNEVEHTTKDRGTANPNPLVEAWATASPKLRSEFVGACWDEIKEARTGIPMTAIYGNGGADEDRWMEG